MRTLGALLIVTFGFGVLAASQAYGDIGLSFLFAAVVALLSGIGFLIAAAPVNAWRKSLKDQLAELAEKSIRGQIR